MLHLYSNIFIFQRYSKVIKREKTINITFNEAQKILGIFLNGVVKAKKKKFEMTIYVW